MNTPKDLITPDDLRSVLHDLHRALKAAWDNRTLPASVVSGELFRRMDAALAVAPDPDACSRIIFTSGHVDAIKVEPGDRRFMPVYSDASARESQTPQPEIANVDKIPLFESRALLRVGDTGHWLFTCGTAKPVPLTNQESMYVNAALRAATEAAK